MTFSLIKSSRFLNINLLIALLIIINGCGGGDTPNSENTKKEETPSIPTLYNLRFQVNGLANTNTVTVTHIESSQAIEVKENGSYIFDKFLTNNAPYTISVTSNPTYQKCIEINNKGVVAGENVNNIKIECTTTPLLEDQRVTSFTSAESYEQLIFKSKESGYAAFRIPAITRTRTGRLLAFAEGRKLNHKDWGDIDIVYKISDDSGKTWSPLKTVISEGEGTWGNPTVVVDQATARIWLFFNSNSPDHSQRGDVDTCRNGPCKLINKWEDRRVYSLSSDDDGESFGQFEDRTETLKPKNMIWDAVGPGNGIQIISSTVMPANRIIVPAINRNFISDDNGKTWTYRMIPKGSSEATIVHTSQDRLVRNDRPTGTLINLKIRAVTTSSDGGETWTDLTKTSQEYNLDDPACQGSSLKFSTAASGTSRILFTNANSKTSRLPLTTRLSLDETASWSASKLIEPKGLRYSSGYTSMVRTPSDHVAIIYEAEESRISNERNIKLKRFNLEWLTTTAP